MTREGVVRDGFSRSGGARPGDDLVPTVRVEPVRLPDVDVDPVRLSRRELPGGDGVGVLDGDDRTSYVAPAEVLFDTDSAELRAAAGRRCESIARRIRASRPAPGCWSRATPTTAETTTTGCSSPSAGPRPWRTGWSTSPGSTAA